MADRPYKLTYFNIRGLAEQVRLLLIDQEIPFEDNRLSREQWYSIVKKTMHFGQIPCLHDGDFQIVQSGAIMRHLGRKHGLYGDDLFEQSYLDMFFDGIRDLHMKYWQLIYEDYDQKYDFVRYFLPTELRKFETLFKSKCDGERYILGEKITFVDYTFFEQLDVLLILAPRCLDQFPALKGFQAHMADRPNLQDYLKQRKQDEVPVNGNGRQ